MTIDIRKANPTDAEGIGCVHHYSWQETYAGLIDSDFLASRTLEKSVEMIKKCGCENNIVAVANGEIVGFCRYDKPRDKDMPSSFGELQAIYILQKYQNMAIGRRLMEKALEELAAMNCDHVYLWVLSTNSKAIAFYERCGFLFDGTEKEDTIGTPVIEKRYVRGL